MRGQHNIRPTAKDNTGQNTDKGHTPSPRIENKIPLPRRESNPDRRDGRQGLYGYATDYLFLCVYNVE